MSLQNRLILFFFVTSLGSALSSIASFLSIEGYFQSLIFIGIALSGRTLAGAVFSYYAPGLIQSLGLRLCLLASQAFGILSLIVLYLGFHWDLFNLTLLGIILTGLPGTFAGILLSILLKVTSNNPDMFRKYSGRRELVFGSALFSASVLTPLFLWKFNLNFVLFIDAISYIFGFFLLLDLKIDRAAHDENEKTSGLGRLMMTSKQAQTYLLKTTASLLLAGLLPLLASSGEISFTKEMPILVRQWLWSIEDITAISASLVYLFFAVIRQKKSFEALVMLSGVWLFLPVVFVKHYTIIIAAVVICLLTDFSGQKFRDDLIVSAGNDLNLIRAYSAMAQFQRNFIFFISPILLSLLFTYASPTIAVTVIIAIQIIFYLGNKRLLVKKIETQNLMNVHAETN